jgi:PKD repeat protein
MKKSFLNLLKRAFLLMGVVSLVTLYSCDKDSEETVKDPIASFQFAVSTSNYLEVTFTNYSQNATSYSWNFGDQQTSTDTDPVHVYDAAGDYDVVLTATNSAGKSATYTQKITITDPNVALRLLTGDVSKDWRLIRSEPCMGVSETPATMFNWWSLSNDGARPCVYEQTWTFNIDGTMTFDDGGTFWGEEFVFDGTDVKNMCFTPDASNMVNKDGVDLTSLLSGTHQFDYNATTGKLSLTGEGVWIGLPKISAAGDVRVPQQSITYDIDITEEEGYDLMTLSMTGDGWFWAFKYASYANPADEPDVVSFRVDFDYTVEDFVVTFVNKSQDATSYSWDFGDGNTSTEENPVHTYAAEGSYEVVLTGTSGSESKTATKTITISLNPTELAPAPTEPEANVISIYSDAYTGVSGVNIDPDWGQATQTQEIEIQSEKVIKMTGLNYQGIDWAATPQDVSGKTKLHVDIYCSVVTDINLSVIGAGENPVKLTTEAGVWKSFDILLSEYTVPDLTQVIQVKFDDAATGTAPTIFVDNIYFY